MYSKKESFMTSGQIVFRPVGTRTSECHTRSPRSDLAPCCLKTKRGLIAGHLLHVRLVGRLWLVAVVRRKRDQRRHRASDRVYDVKDELRKILANLFWSFAGSGHKTTVVDYVEK